MSKSSATNKEEVELQELKIGEDGREDEVEQNRHERTNSWKSVRKFASSRRGLELRQPTRRHRFHDLL